MRPIAALAILLAACSQPNGNERSDLVTQIDSLAELMLSVDPTPGLSVAVVQGEDTIVVKGYGLAHADLNRPMTHQTVLAVGSVTKQFTAATVMRLVEEGRLDLDATLGATLPDYNGPGNSATIRQLLNHTSGIPSFTRAGSRYRELRHRLLPTDTIRSLFETEPLEFAPGSTFSYNNSGYYLLGIIVERVTGTAFSEFLVTTVLDPLAIRNTKACSEASGRAQGYTRRLGQLAPDSSERFENAGAAGGLCSTAVDLVRWTQSLTDGEVVSPASYHQLVAPTVADTDTVPYGYGLSLGDLDGHRFVAHGGSIPGFRAAVAHYPDSALTIVVLANGPFPAEFLEREIARAVLGIGRQRYE